MDYYLRKVIKHLLEPKHVKVAALIFTFLVAIGSLISLQGKIKSPIVHLDKLIHFLAYNVLSLLWLKVFVTKNNVKKAISLVSIVVLVYGIIIEVMQGVLTNYRQFDTLDILANFFGILSAAAIFWAVYYKK